MRLILVSAPEPLENEGLILNNILRRGCQTLHLRKPQYSANAYEQVIRDVDASLHGRLVLHSHHHLADKYPVKVRASEEKS